jgi:hypothetical protein
VTEIPTVRTEALLGIVAVDSPEELDMQMKNRSVLSIILVPDRRCLQVEHPLVVLGIVTG